MIEMELTKGYKTTVCDCHYNKVKDYKWSAQISRYQVRAVRGISRNNIRHTYLMHREIMDVPKGMEIDHIDGNTLNNQCSNLRICSKFENARNVRLTSKNTSGHKGVCWSKHNNRWHARVICNNHTYHLGYFLDKQEAIDAYNKKAKELHGEYFRES